MPHERLTEVWPLRIRRDGAASCRTGDSSLVMFPTPLHLRSPMPGRLRLTGRSTSPMGTRRNRRKFQAFVTALGCNDGVERRGQRVIDPELGAATFEVQAERR
jgi:hypothetical protein